MLSTAGIESAVPREKPYKLFDERGLYLLVNPRGGRGWRFKYRIRGREKLLSFGTFPAVSLAKARAHCKSAKALLREGVDPSVSRQAAKFGGADSFEPIAREWYGTYAARWKASYQEHIIRRLERDIFEARGTHETAHRVYQNICWVFRHAAVTGRCAYDPCTSIKGRLLPMNEEHLASITDPDAFGELLRAIDAYIGSNTVRAALRLAPLVFVRPKELRGAEWAELHFEDKQWRIPAERMKMRVPHIVPLSTQAMAILEDIRPASGDDKYDNWRLGGRNLVRAAYSHARYLTERTMMMQGCANYLDGLRAGRA